MEGEDEVRMIGRFTGEGHVVKIRRSVLTVVEFFDIG